MMNNGAGSLRTAINRTPLREAAATSRLPIRISELSFPRTGKKTGSIDSQDNREEEGSSSKKNWDEVHGERPKVRNIRKIFGIKRNLFFLSPTWETFCTLLVIYIS
jgi:hypothetical protein